MASKDRAWVVAGFMWMALVLVGFIVLGFEEYRSAAHTVTKDAFPANSALSLDPDKPTLLLFVHPKCPCTRATFADLESLRTQTRDGLAVTIVFTIPPDVPPGWELGSLWTQASRMKDVRIFRDLNGIEARRFGVTASGHVLVYAKSGRLLFSGGITPSRGHEGDSPGESAIVRLTSGGVSSDKVEKPVFGCTLL